MKAKRRPRLSNERKVYYPNPALRAVTTAIALVLAAAAIGFAYYSTLSFISTLFCTLPIGLFFFMVLTYLSYTGRKTYLVLTPSGVEYHSALLTIRTPWSNVERIVEDALTPRLVLREPAQLERNEESALQRRWADQSAGRAIPLRMFGYSRQSQLGQDLQRFAPNLFQPTERSPST
jgi:hypothetical protein